MASRGIASRRRYMLAQLGSSSRSARGVAGEDLGEDLWNICDGDL
jgi:hypothetical protein